MAEGIFSGGRNVLALAGDVLIILLPLCFVLWAVIHASITKKEPRSAIAWIALIILSPVIGALVYYMMGVNRIRKKASELKRQNIFTRFFSPESEDRGIEKRRYTENLPEESRENIKNLMLAGDYIIQGPMLPGNDADILENGDEFYPRLIEEINSAKEYIILQTYIFDMDEAGLKIIDALRGAVERGVEVSVLVDAIGMRYSPRHASKVLKKNNINYALFLPAPTPFHFIYYHLRSHRKIIVIDGEKAFTGGMNIRNQFDRKGKEKLRDTHFEIKGPIVESLRRVFVDDWDFSKGGGIERARKETSAAKRGNIYMRGVPDGPDKDFENARWTILNAISNAQKEILVQTPYFVPDSEIITALCLADIRGVDVKLLIPEKGNLPFVQWAAEANLIRLVNKDVEVYKLPGVFDHSKLMVVDACWSFIGSVNWDAVSLRLNFEYNVESYDRGFAAKIRGILKRKIEVSRPMTLEELRSIGILKRTRNGIARLFSPYL
ncbi:MAG TPA: cardiolipin synthase [Firmicutes bacterium]|nr:cardiolipin synthase [Bacillota bacterium]